MTTLNEIATDALQRLHVLEGGETPAAEDIAVAIQRLLQLVEELPEYGAGRKFTEATVERNTTAQEDERIICSVTGLTVTLPATPSDGARVSVVPITGTTTVTPTVRKLEGAAADQTISAATTWAYRADLADWVKVTDLTKNSDSPWPASCDNALGAIVAVETANEFGAEVSASLSASYQKGKAMLQAKYSRPRNVNFNAALPQSVRGPNRLYRTR